MSRFIWFGKRKPEKSRYATGDEFVSAFDSEQSTLRDLAYLLTGDSEAANDCLTGALRECVTSSSVSRDWIATWTRRVVIRHAIGLVMESRSQPECRMRRDAGKGVTASSPCHALSPILDLPEFDRFAFVMCVLEHYSVHDCALLLNKAPRRVCDALQRTGRQIGRAVPDNDSSPQAPVR